MITASPQVLLVEDHSAARCWLQDLVQRALPEAEVVTAATLHHALTLVPRRAWTLALVDLGLPDGQGMTLLEVLRAQQPDTLSIVITVHTDDQHLFRALAAGAQGYLLKSQPADQLMEQLRQFNAGAPLLAPAIARRMLEHFRQRHRDEAGRQPLTARETDILRAIGRGMKVSEVALHLHLTESTVASYIKQIYRKLSISNRAEAALEAARRGLLQSGAEQ